MSMRLSPWDIAGGIVIAQEVGAVATNMKGEFPHLLGQDTFIVARPGLHQDICDKLYSSKIIKKGRYKHRIHPITLKRHI